MLTDCNNPQPFRTVNCVVDSLYLRILRPGIPSDYLKAQLPRWRAFKKAADETTGQALVRLPGLGTFELKPFGQKPYELVFVNRDIGNIYIWNPDRWESSFSSQTGQFLVDFRSKYLQFYGLEGVKSFVKRLSELFVYRMNFGNGAGWERISRVDLSTDTQLPVAPTWADLPRYVSRSRKQDAFTDSAQAELQQARELLQTLKPTPPPTGNKGGATYNLSPENLELLKRAVNSATLPEYEDNYLYRAVYQRDLQSIYFGRMASSLLCNRYDKLASLKVQKKEYLKAIWKKNGWDGQSPVWRTEFRLKAPFLKQAGIALGGSALNADMRDFYLFCKNIGHIWQYLTRDWLRLTIPDPEDSNRWRWGLDPEWEVIQQAFPAAEAIKRYKPPSRPIDEQLRAQMRGVALTLAAKRAQTDRDDDVALEVLQDLGAFFSGDSFYDRLTERRGKLGCDDFTFAALADQLRAEHLLNGEGS